MLSTNSWPIRVTICKKNPVLPSLALFLTLILALTPWISAPTIPICPTQHIQPTSSHQIYVIPGLPPLPLVLLIIIHLYLLVHFTLFHLVSHFFVYFSLSWVVCLIPRPFLDHFQFPSFLFCFPGLFPIPGFVLQFLASWLSLLYFASVLVWFSDSLEVYKSLPVLIEQTLEKIIVHQLPYLLF